MRLIFKIILCTAFFFATKHVNAQNPTPKESKFSVNMGYVQGLERFKIDNLLKQKYNEHGAFIGLRYDRPFNNKLVSYGSGITVLLLNETAYLQIPLEARLNIKDIATIQAGPSVNFRPDQIGENNMDVNLSISTAVRVDVSSRFYVTLRYNHQLNNYYRDDYILGNAIDFRMHVLTTGIGVKF